MVERIGGINRYDTSVKIAERMYPSMDFSDVVITNGTSFPDAISISPYASKLGYPILLSRQTELPEEVQALLKKINDLNSYTSKSYVIGGEAALSNNIVSNLDYPVRLSGSNRYDTNVNIIDYFGYWGDEAFVATGMNFPDALTGSVLAAKKLAPTLLVRKDNIAPSTDRMLSIFNKYTIFGGTNAISEEVKAYIETFELEEPIEEPIEEPVDPGFEYLELNKPYTADNQLTVTVLDLETIEYEGFYEYHVRYHEKNNTDQAIDQGTFKIYYNDDSSEPQYGFFNKLYPGQESERTYTFLSEKTKSPLLIEYGGDVFFNSKPAESTLKWKIEH